MSGFRVSNACEVEFEAERILNFLASLPRGVTSAERPVVREIMLRTSGELLVQGEIFDIVAKNLGAGAYQLRLALRKSVGDGDRALALRQATATRKGEPDGGASRGLSGPKAPAWTDEDQREEEAAINTALDQVDTDAEAQFYRQGRSDGREAERRRWIALSAFLLLLCLALPAGALGPGAWVVINRPLPTRTQMIPQREKAPTLRGPARVVDGDTLEVAGEKVRLHGIDAPEKDQTCRRAGAPWHCGWTAAVRLEELIGGRPVRCLGVERDRYNRVIARCYVVGERGPALDLGGALVVRGLAVAYRKYSLDYAGAEAIARTAQAGMWAGTFVQPEEWRRGGGR